MTDCPLEFLNLIAILVIFILILQSVSLSSLSHSSNWHPASRVRLQEISPNLQDILYSTPSPSNPLVNVFDSFSYMYFNTHRPRPPLPRYCHPFNPGHLHFSSRLLSYLHFSPPAHHILIQFHTTFKMVVLKRKLDKPSFIPKTLPWLRTVFSVNSKFLTQSRKSLLLHLLPLSP